MARTKKGEVSKSDAVRAYMAEHKNAKAADIVAALAEKGVQVSVPLIYALKGKARSKRGRPKTTKGAAKTTSGNGKVSLETLLAAKKLADGMGGIEKAREALNLLAKLS